MVKKRIIPTLLTDGMSLVKGDSFDNWRTVGSVVSAAKVFNLRDVDELVILDVNATTERRTISLELVKNLASFLRVPFTVGGGVNSLIIFEQLIQNGADKVVLGTAAIENPELISQAANHFGSQAVVVSIDIADLDTGEIATHSGKNPLKINAQEASNLAISQGAGEILLQAIPLDGLMVGMADSWIKKISFSSEVPVIASGGASSTQNMAEVFDLGASAVAAGALFQFTEVTPKTAREFLSLHGYSVRN